MSEERKNVSNWRILLNFVVVVFFFFCSNDPFHCGNNHSEVMKDHVKCITCHTHTHTKSFNKEPIRPWAGWAWLWNREPMIGLLYGQHVVVVLVFERYEWERLRVQRTGTGTKSNRIYFVFYTCVDVVCAMWVLILCCGRRQQKNKNGKKGKILFSPRIHGNFPCALDHQARGSMLYV